MLRLSMQFFAHKKVLVPQRTAVTLNPNVSAQNVQTVSSYWLVTFCTVREELTFIQEKM